MKSCPLCSSANTELVTGRLRFDQKGNVLKCRECSLVFLDPQSAVLPKDFYEGAYHQTYLTHIEPSALDCRAYYEKMLQTTKPWAERILAEIRKGDTVLDFGCSTGHLMKQLAPKAGKVYGHELNKKEVEFCRTQLNLDVSDEPLEKRFAGMRFDRIVMLFVLEHIAEPIKLLKELRKLLKPDGQILIVVPSAEDALLNFYDIPRFRDFYFCIEHLFYYSQKTLGVVLQKAGFQTSIETLQEYPVTNHLNWGYRQKPSDVLASRRLIPDIPLRKEEFFVSWEKFWNSVDIQYKEFLKQNNWGDRLWCRAEIQP